MTYHALKEVMPGDLLELVDRRRIMSRYEGMIDDNNPAVCSLEQGDLAFVVRLNRARTEIYVLVNNHLGWTNNSGYMRHDPHA